MTETNPSVLNAWNEAYGTVDPNTEGSSGLGWWPEEGIHLCLVNAITMSPCKVYVSDNRDSKETAPGTKIQFSFALLEDSESPENPRQFNGQPFTIPNDPRALAGSEKKREKVNRDLARLKGHVTTILTAAEKTPTGNLMVDFETAKAVISVGAISVAVNCTKWQSDPKSKPYLCEYVKPVEKSA